MSVGVPEVSLRRKTRALRFAYHGPELSFAQEVRKVRSLPWFAQAIQHKRAIFRKINEHKPAAHHDALEFPDGRIVLLTLLKEGQHATVLQLFAAPVIDTKTTKRETDAVSLSKTS